MAANANVIALVISGGAGSITVIGAIWVVLGLVRSRLPNRPKEESSSPTPDEIPIDDDALRWSIRWAIQSMVLFYLLTGALLLIGPRWAFGKTWFYFQGIPHGGGGMGFTMMALSIAMIFAIWRKNKKWMSNVLFASGITFWIAAFLIAAQGVAARTECIEALFMMYPAVDMMIRAAVIRR